MQAGGPPREGVASGVGRTNPKGSRLRGARARGRCEVAPRGRRLRGLARDPLARSPGAPGPARPPKKGEVEASPRALHRRALRNSGEGKVPGGVHARRRLAQALGATRATASPAPSSPHTERPGRWVRAVDRQRSLPWPPSGWGGLSRRLR